MIAFSKSFPSFDKVFKYIKVMNTNGLNSINLFNGKRAIIKDTFLGDLRKTFFYFFDFIQGQMTDQQTPCR